MSYYEIKKFVKEFYKKIKRYSEMLTRELGKGYNVSNLKNMCQFYLSFRKRQAVPGELTWNICKKLSKL